MWKVIVNMGRACTRRPYGSSRNGHQQISPPTEAALIELAAEVNTSMPDYVVEPFEDAANKNTPPKLRFQPNGPVFAGKLFSFVFITIACGAISGFHALVSSGTTPKLLANEADARMIGYGGMLLDIGDVDEAISQLQQSLHYDPKDANSLFNLGMIRGSVLLELMCLFEDTLIDDGILTVTG